MGYHSLCEAVLLDSRFADLRLYVGIANIFFSHMQKECLLTFSEKGTLDAITKSCQREFSSELPPPVEQFIWLDYFSLRQAIDDFEAEAVVEFVASLPALVANIDRELVYA